MSHTLMHPAIGIQDNGHMGLIGFDENDPLHAVLCRIEERQKAGQMPADADLELIADLPVIFQRDCDACALTVEPLRHRY